MAELAAVPQLPPAGAYLWNWFCEVSAGRQSGGLGISRLSRLEIQAWEQDEMVRLAHWERRVILKLDELFCASADTPGEEGEGAR